MTTLRQLLNDARSRLTPVYGESESVWMLRIIMEHVKGWNQIELLMRADNEVSGFIIGEVNKAIDRLLCHEPIQYIYGDTYWHGMTLHVSPAVLIPRPETGELVDIIVNKNTDPDLNVLDLCTGSGCIAIALAKFMNFPKVTGLDISPEAIAMAKRNASAQKINVTFQTADVLTLKPEQAGIYDIIVSNPPYVMNKEKNEMEANVLDYEPSIALFVPDAEPLKFYKAIASYAREALSDNGSLYFELNPLTAGELKDWMKQDGWSDITLLSDSRAKTRFMIAKK